MIHIITRGRHESACTTDLDRPRLFDQICSLVMSRNAQADGQRDVGAGLPVTGQDRLFDFPRDEAPTDGRRVGEVKGLAEDFACDCVDVLTADGNFNGLALFGSRVKGVRVWVPGDFASV